MSCKATGPNPEFTRVLAAVDEVAATWVAAARPVVFRVARACELSDVFRLRYHAAVDEEWATPEDFPGGLERDAHDEEAIHVVGENGASIVATSRLVLPVPSKLLPTEEAFELTLASRMQVADLGRVVVTPGYRSSRHTLLAGLLGSSWREARAQGLCGLVGIVSAAMLERYRELSIELAILAPARRYWNQDRFPVLLDAEATIATNQPVV